MPSQTPEMKPIDVFNKLSGGEALQIIDVREADEFNSVRLESSSCLPLSLLNHNHRFIHPEKDAYLLCRSGERAKQAAKKLAGLGVKNTVVIEGGLEAWRKEGLPLEKSVKQVWSMDRQVKFTASLLILDGIALAYSVNPCWILLSAFVALGMLVSSIADTCAMATALGLLPWNRTSQIKGEVSPAKKFCVNGRLSSHGECK